MNITLADEPDAVWPVADSTESGFWDRLRESVERVGSECQRQREPEFVARKLAERAKAFRSPLQPDRPGDSALFVSFSTARERYGVPVAEVLEIEPLEHFCPVPHAPPFIRGVIQWRGTILTLLDLGQLFSIPLAGITDLRGSVIVEAAGRRIAVAAGEIEEILTIANKEIMIPPDLPSNIPSAWLIGVHDNNRMLVSMEEVLNDARITQWRGNKT